MALLRYLRQMLLGENDTASAPVAFEDDDIRLAVAVLLVHMLRVDGVSAPQEQEAMRALLTSEYELKADQVDDLIDLAIDRDNEAIDIYRFTSLIKARTQPEQRLRIVEMLWQISYADNALHEFEDNLVWRVAELLGVSSRDRMLLKQKVRARHDA